MYLGSRITRPRSGDQAFQTFVELQLLMTSVSPSGHLTLGPHLMTAREVDELVNTLKQELDRFAKEAKTALRR